MKVNSPPRACFYTPTASNAALRINPGDLLKPDSPVGTVIYANTASDALFFIDQGHKSNCGRSLIHLPEALIQGAETRFQVLGHSFQGFNFTLRHGLILQILK